MERFTYDLVFWPQSSELGPVIIVSFTDEMAEAPRLLVGDRARLSEPTPDHLALQLVQADVLET